MNGGPTTNGLSSKRASARASGTINTSLPPMACAQNETSRDV
jgi:hypothetical protein